MAEDEAGLRKYVRRILERKGYMVLEASNGNQALETARVHRGPIHLLLTDLVMPEMGGVDLVGEFGSLRPHVPVLCMSGYSERLWRQGDLTSYLQKPFTPVMLLTSGTIAFGHRGNRGQPPHLSRMNFLPSRLE